MNPAGQNITLHFMNMNEQRKKKLHCDVTIIVDKKTFPCHRLVLSSVSTYFSAMFNNDFDESRQDVVTLKEEINATTFEEILNAMYTTQICITPQNAYCMWKACSFLGMSIFEIICVEYIEDHLPVDNLIEVCHFADVLKEEGLLKALTKYIAGNIVELSKTYKLSQLSFDLLKRIFCRKNLIRNDDTVLSIIVSWAKQKSDRNVKLTTELLETAKLTKITMSTMAELITNPNFTECQLDAQSSENSDVKLEIVSKNLRGRGSLNVYMKAYNEDRCCKDTIVVQYDQWNKRWNAIENFNCSFDNLKTVVIENRQYFLAYDRNRNSWSNRSTLFWMVENEKRTLLREPPVTAEYYHLATMGNTIYLYCSLKNITTVSIPTISNLEYQNEDITNCVFAYNCDVDMWTSPPPIVNMVEGACLISHKHSIYVIGGRNLTHDAMNRDTGLQEYDYRESKWHTKSIDYPEEPNNFYYHAAACVYKEKIYLSGSYDFLDNSFCHNVDEYVLTAQKFNSLSPMGIGRANHRLVAYNDFLYAMDNKHHSVLEKYDLRHVAAWQRALYFPKKVKFNGSTLCPYDVTDAIV